MSDQAPTFRERAMLAPSTELRWLVLTQDQAQILRQLVLENRGNITEQWSYGVFDGLCTSLCEIDNAGGAYIRYAPASLPS